MSNLLFGDILVSAIQLVDNNTSHSLKPIIPLTAAVVSSSRQLFSSLTPRILNQSFVDQQTLQVFELADTIPFASSLFFRFRHTEYVNLNMPRGAATAIPWSTPVEELLIRVLNRIDYLKKVTFQQTHLTNEFVKQHFVERPDRLKTLQSLVLWNADPRMSNFNFTALTFKNFFVLDVSLSVDLRICLLNQLQLILSDFYAVPSFREKARECSLVETLAARLSRQGEPQRLRIHYVKTLRALCVGDVELSFDTVMTFIPALLDMLHGDDDDLRREICEFLFDSVNEKPAVLEMILANNVSILKDVFGVFEFENTKAFFPALRFLGNFSTLSDEACNQLVSLGILPILEKALVMPEPPVQAAHREKRQKYYDYFEKYVPQKEDFFKFREMAEKELGVVDRYLVPASEEFSAYIHAVAVSDAYSEKAAIRKEACWMLSNIVVSEKREVVKKENLCRMVVRNAFDSSQLAVQNEALVVLANLFLYYKGFILDTQQEIIEQLLNLEDAVCACFAFMDQIVATKDHTALVKSVTKTLLTAFFDCTAVNVRGDGLLEGDDVCARFLRQVLYGSFDSMLILERLRDSELGFGKNKFLREFLAALEKCTKYCVECQDWKAKYEQAEEEKKELEAEIERLKKQLSEK
jgi:hypothetical protein